MVTFQWRNMVNTSSTKFSRVSSCRAPTDSMIQCDESARKWSRSVVSDSLRPHGLQPARLLYPWGFPGKNTGVGCHFLLQRIFPRSYLTSAIFPSNEISLNMRKTLYKLKLRNILQKSDQSQGYHGQGKIKNYYRLYCQGDMMTKCKEAAWIKPSYSTKDIGENW